MENKNNVKKSPLYCFFWRWQDSQNSPLYCCPLYRITTVFINYLWHDALLRASESPCSILFLTKLNSWNKNLKLLHLHGPCSMGWKGSKAQSAKRIFPSKITNNLFKIDIFICEASLPVLSFSTPIYSSVSSIDYKLVTLPTRVQMTPNLQLEVKKCRYLFSKLRSHRKTGLSLENFWMTDFGIFSENRP